MDSASQHNRAHGAFCSCHARQGRHPAHVPDAEEIYGRLRQRHFKMTPQRQMVLDVLRQEHLPLTMKEIHGRTQSSDLATVYRTVNMLERVGLVRRSVFGDGSARFELACACGGLHHQHLVCTRCGEVMDVEVSIPEEILASLASETGYAGLESRLEFFGICKKCQSGGSYRVRE